MIVFPNCKINLGLYILQKRTDGFHDLETAFYPVPLQDALEVLPDESLGENKLSLSGHTLDAAGGNNICLKAWQILKRDFHALPFVKIHLHKVIPAGAGLGGGSADGAFTLLLLNNTFQLGLSENDLIKYALKLGSDCPFFIRNKPIYASGRGEVMEEIDLNLSGYSLVLVNPRIHVPTGWAFSQIKPENSRQSIKEILQSPITQWKDRLTNDFEPIVFSKHPEVGKIKEDLYTHGALYASMSGSGSTIFGIFEKTVNLSLSFPPGYIYKVL